MKNPMALGGRNIIVTGAAQGIGDQGYIAMNSRVRALQHES